MLTPNLELEKINQSLTDIAIQTVQHMQTYTCTYHGIYVYISILVYTL